MPLSWGMGVNGNNRMNEAYWKFAFFATFCALLTVPYGGPLALLGVAVALVFLRWFVDRLS
jgi:energy-coupling factor transporter transmembrane protein EcfT